MKEIIRILGVKLHPLTMRETVELVEQDFIIKEKPLHLMGVNADKINQCVENPKMFDIVNNCGLVNADGASVVLAGRYLGFDIPERVAGIDLMRQLLELSEKKGYTVYFLGAKETVIQKMLQKFEIDFPKLKVVGYKNGFFLDEELESISLELVEKKPQIVFVGITSPKKELVIEHFMSFGINSVFMGVGGSFDVLSGEIPRAPLWMQRMHMEWFFRVLNEPKRLFKRYFVGNARFIKRVIQYKYKGMNESESL